MHNLSITFKEAIKFFTLPFNTSNLKALSKSEQLKFLVLEDRQKGKVTSLDNDSIEQGSERIQLLLWNQTIASTIKTELLISTNRLDPKLYSDESIKNLELLLTNKSAKILYKHKSPNILKLQNKFGAEVIRQTNEAIDNFIVSKIAMSVEKEQVYNENVLEIHKASFYFNFDVAADESIKVNAEILKKQFYKTWDSSRA